MSNPRKIEQLAEATDLQENDLMFASVLDAGNTYVSKKVTLANIANYVRNGMEPVPDGSGFGGYEIYDLSDSDGNYINGQTVGNDGFTKTFTRDCEILVTPSSVPTQQGSYGDITVKVDNVQLSTGLFALGIGNLAQFYVKAGQTLSITGTTGSTVKVYSRPLKSGGNFFIYGTEALSSPFTGCGRVDRDASNNTFEFTASQKTLFIYSHPSAGAGLDSVKINGVEINWKIDNNAHHYDKLILDTNDTINFTFTTVDYMIYCALPLLEV